MSVQYKVKEGDSIPSIAFEYGFLPDSLWNHANNAELKRKRQNMNILMPDDIVFVPGKERKIVSRPTENQHVFRRKGVPSVFHLQLFDGEKPLAGQKYILTVDGKLIAGVTNEIGALRHQIPPHVKQGKLRIGENRSEIILKFGSLDPVDELLGVQKRLNNLGYSCGEPNGALNEQTKHALRSFQNRFELEESGQPDRATIDKITELHDSDNLFPPQSENQTGSLSNAAANN